MSRLFTFLCLSLLFNLAQAQLPTPEYKKGQAILSGTIANYNPDDNLIFKIGGDIFEFFFKLLFLYTQSMQQYQNNDNAYQQNTQYNT